MPYPNDVDLGRWHFLISRDDIDAYLEQVRETHASGNDGVQLMEVHLIEVGVAVDCPIYVRSSLLEGMGYIDDPIITHEVITARELTDAHEINGPDAIIENLYPECDAIHIDIGHWAISVGRQEDESVHVTVVDNNEGSVTFLVLGKEGETQRT